MENSQYLFRSQFHKAGIIAPLLGTAMFVWQCYYHPSLRMSIELVILFGILFNYLLLAVFQSRYYFYDHQIIRVFVFRLFYRRKAFRYESIKIRYINVTGIGGASQFVIFKRKYRPNLGSLFNTFYFNKCSTRIQIVDFLLSKDVKMEIKTDFEKEDKEIIDLVKKKYPQAKRHRAPLIGHF